MSPDKTINRFIFKYLVLILGFTIIIWSNFVSIDSTSNQTHSIIEQSIKSMNRLRNDCEPLFKTNKQYSVTIDGQVYPQVIYLNQNTLINFDCLNKSNQTKIISIMTPIKNDLFGFEKGSIGPFEKNHCPVTNCEFTNQIDKLNESNLVLFEMQTKMHRYIPNHRMADQRYVFMLYESPVNSPNFERYSSFFNLTSTYDSDSDFPGFYSSWKFKWHKNETFNDTFDYTINKLKFSAAIVSNFNDKANRLSFLNELNKFIPIDIFGKCGQKCPEYYSNTTIRGSCKNIIAKEYKFLLAFENSFCKDYITEKLFDILNLDTIPVVRGAGDYDYYIPKSGYIDALDFKSVESLAEYLVYLNANKTAYNSYFKWKKHVNFYEALYPDRNHNYRTICDMCIYLHLEDFFGIEKKTIFGNPHRKEDCSPYSNAFNSYFLSLIIVVILAIIILMLIIKKIKT